MLHRRKRSVKATQEAENGEDCIVYGKNRLELYRFEEEVPFFFHPNLAMIRIKRIINGESDPYFVAGDITAGSTVLDCTLGLGADAIVASFAVGQSGKVVALEDNRFIAFLVGSWNKYLGRWRGRHHSGYAKSRNQASSPL